MKLLKLSGSFTSNVIAQVTKHKDKLYYNIKHGTRGLWVYSIGLDSLIFKPENDTGSLVLKEDNYILTPIRNAKGILVDNRGNHIYNVSVDHMDNHKKDLIVFWEIPNKYYKNVTITISGAVAELGRGIVGRERDGIIYESPAPVLEIVGDAILKWTGVDKSGNEVGQVIQYNYLNNDWGITQIKEENHD